MKYTIIISSLAILFLLGMSCQQKKNLIVEDKSTTTLPSNIIATEIIVQVKESQDIKLLVRDFKGYMLKNIKTIAPNPPMYVVTFDESKVDPTKILEEIKSHSKVVNANFNKKTGARDR